MHFEDTLLELRGLARNVAVAFEQNSFRMFAERALNEDVRFRTTLLGEKGRERVLVEVQSRLVLGSAILDLARLLRRNLEYASLYLATSFEAEMSGRLLGELKHCGVGLLLVRDNGTIQTVQRAQVFALLVPPTPPVPLGQLKGAICALCVRFNDGDRKGALSDLFEFVEQHTDRLVDKAVRKGWLNLNQQAPAQMDWASKINILASRNQATGTRSPLLEPKLKDDLHSFRGARNLFLHPVSGVRAENRRELQFHERMIQGPRLLSELLRLQRRVQ